MHALLDMLTVIQDFIYFKLYRLPIKETQHSIQTKGSHGAIRVLSHFEWYRDRGS